MSRARRRRRPRRGLDDGCPGRDRGRAPASTCATASTSSGPPPARSSPRTWSPASRPAGPPRSAPTSSRPIAQRPADGLAAAGLAAARKAGALGDGRRGDVRAAGARVAAPGGAVVRAALLRRLPRPTDTLAGLRRSVDRLGRPVRRAAAGRGRRPRHGPPRRVRQPRARRDASVAEAVEASCTVPWLFAPVQIGGREYVDGGVWSPTNLDAAPGGPRHARAVPEPDREPRRHAARCSRVVRNVARHGGVARGARAAAPRRRGADGRPERRVRRGDGNELHGLASPAARVLAAGYRQGLALVDGVARSRVAPRRPATARAPSSASAMHARRRRTAFDSART